MIWNDAFSIVEWFQQVERGEETREGHYGVDVDGGNCKNEETDEEADR